MDFNSLPEDVISSKTVLKYKTKLDKLLIHRTFEDIDIYLHYKYILKHKRKATLSKMVVTSF